MEHRLNEVIISVTNRCNLRCSMCQIPAGGRQTELSGEEMQRLVADAVHFCPRSIVFSGGEPLLREDIFDLIAFVNRHRINTCLASNGTLLTEEVARKLVAAGIGVVNISVEGDEATHDALRGKGNYVKAVEALKNLSKHNIETTIATIVSRQNYEALPKVMELAYQFGVTTVKFQPFSDIFLKDKGLRGDFFAPRGSQPDIEKSLVEVIRLAQEYKIMTNPQEYLHRIPAYLCGETVINAEQKGCSALWSSCPVSSEGNVYPCWVLDDKVIGNVKKKKLSEIWGSRKHDRLRREIETKGCGGCMMSCYDQNFGKQKTEELISLKVQKLTKPGFYRRMYNRVYQNTKYLLGKVANKIRIWFLVRQSADKSKTGELLKEIKASKEILKKKLKSFE
ncbi:MAG: radical SAM protein [Candidatus Omnitrophota bacterium]